MNPDKLVRVFLLLLLVLSLVKNIVPQVKAVPSGQVFATEITNAPAKVSSVDVDSHGRVFIVANGKIYRSLDNGVSWAQLATSLTGLFVHFVKIDSRDYVYIANSTYNGCNGTLYRSTNYGETFSIVYNIDINNPWKMTEMPNGTLLFNSYDNYGNNIGTIWRSSDSGATWFKWYERTGVTHFHSVRANPYNNDVWLATGDVSKAWVQRFRSDTNSWENVTSTYHMFTDFMFDSTYVYLVPDTINKLYRMPNRGSWSEAVELVDLQYDDTSNSQGIGYSMMAVNYGDFMVMGTDKSTVLTSIDGERWIKILETPGNNTIYNGYGVAWRFTCLSSRKPVYAVNLKYGKLYRLDISKEDVAQQTRNIWINTFKRGSITDASNYVLEQVLTNGTNQLSLTNVPLKDARATLKGLGHTTSQMSHPNSGWELGSTSGWTWEKTGNPAYAVTSADKHGEAYSLNVTMTNTESVSFYNKTTKVTTKTGEKMIFGLYYKIPILWDDYSMDFEIRRVSNDALLYTDSQYLFNSVEPIQWQLSERIWTSTVSTDVYLKIILYMPTNTTSVLIDDIYCMSRKEYESARQAVANGDTFVYKTHRWNPFLIVTDVTQNPLVTVGSQTLFHNGFLTNGTESAESIALGTIAGVLPVNTNIQGSGLAILRVTGTRLFSINELSLQGATSDGAVFYGRYTSTPTIPTSITKIVAATNYTALINQVSYNGNLLTFTINSPYGTTSCTQVYVGDKGQPKNVTGASSWSYDAATKILTAIAVHSSSTIITVKWKFPGDVNDDSRVNATDLLLLSDAYGSTGEPLPSSDWNPDADLNGDNIINVLDLAIISRNYGKI